MPSGELVEEGSTNEKEKTAAKKKKKPKKKKKKAERKANALAAAKVKSPKGQPDATPQEPSEDGIAENRVNSWTAFGLDSRLCHHLVTQGLHDPTDIQVWAQPARARGFR